MIEVKLNPDVKPTGSDLGVVNAARRSFNKRSDWEYRCVACNAKEGEGCAPSCSTKMYRPCLKDKDKSLLEFLVRGLSSPDWEDLKADLRVHHFIKNDPVIEDIIWKFRNTPTHDTPFNHGFFSFEVKAPIFVRAQLVKHEYLIMSEFSRRYITDDVEFYEPDYWRKAAEDKKQGSLEEAVEGVNVDSYTKFAVSAFKYLLNKGVAPEQARMVLPQSTMTEWTWSGTLGAFAKMCQLRLHPDAQYESRLVAQQVYEHLKKQFPVSAKLLVEGVSNV